MPATNWKNLILLIICGTLTTLLIGFLFTGLRIFQHDQPPFQFFTYGLLGSVIYAMLLLRTKKDFAAAFIFLVFLDIVVLRIVSIPLLILRILSALVLAISVFSYWRFLRSQPPFWLRPLLLAGLFACVTLGLLLLVSVFYWQPDIRLLIEAQTFFALLIGFGLGIGFEVFNFIHKK